MLFMWFAVLNFCDLCYLVLWFSFGSKQLKLKCNLCGVMQFYAVHAVYATYEVWFQLCEVYAAMQFAVLNFCGLCYLVLWFSFGSKQLNLKCSLCTVMHFYAVHAVYANYEVWF